MDLVRWDPFKDLQGLQDRMNNLFSETTGRRTGRYEDLFGGQWSPRVDIYETKEAFVVSAEVPGMDLKDLDLQIQENVLTLKGDRRFEREVEEDSYHRVERAYGTFQRSFALPKTVDQDNVKAGLKDGVLEVRIPKQERVKPKQVQVEVAS